MNADLMFHLGESKVAFSLKARMSRLKQTQDDDIKVFFSFFFISGLQRRLNDICLFLHFLLSMAKAAEMACGFIGNSQWKWLIVSVISQTKRPKVCSRMARVPLSIGSWCQYRKLKKKKKKKKTDYVPKSIVNLIRTINQKFWMKTLNLN